MQTIRLNMRGPWEDLQGETPVLELRYATETIRFKDLERGGVKLTTEGFSTTCECSKNTIVECHFESAKGELLPEHLRPSVDKKYMLNIAFGEIRDEAKDAEIKICADGRVIISSKLFLECKEKNYYKFGCYPFDIQFLKN